MIELGEDIGPLRRRAAVLFLIVFSALAVVHLRLVDLQLLRGSEWRYLAENNRLRRLPLPGARGWIYDRRGRVLADNVPSWELLLFPDEAENVAATAVFLGRLGISDLQTFRERLGERRIVRMAPMVVGENLTWEQVAAVRAHQSDYPELSVVNRFRRHSPFGNLTAHVVGHLRPVSNTEVEANPHLDPDTMVGATGIEAGNDAFLAARSGERWVMVSAVGKQLGVVRETEPAPGRDLGVTLDVELQEVAARALGERAGAVVAMDVYSGAVRVFYSAPSFDPEIFGGRLSRADWQALQEDPFHPLQNRCLQGVYPPGSTIKPFLALAGLAEGLITPETTVRCSGSVVLYGHRFRCWVRGGHGVVNLETSLEESCDTYYYLLGQKLGIEGMATWMHHFGFGKRTEVGLSPEATGLIGTPEWSRRVRGTPWYPGEAVSVSIGQGPVLTTVVQLARAFATLANGGQLVTPHLVSVRNRRSTDLEVDPENLAQVNRGLERVVHGTHGTARRLASLPVAGKTGTAQVARLQEGVKVEDLPPHLRHHAWFVGWMPLDHPELVVAIVVEHGGGGARAAVPVAAEVFRTYLAGRDNDLGQGAATQPAEASEG